MTTVPSPLNRATTTEDPGDVQIDGVYRALADPLSDRLFSLLLHVATELWTVRDRLQLVERALVNSGVEIDSALETIRQSDEYVTDMRADRDAFIARIMAPMNPERGRADSPLPR